MTASPTPPDFFAENANKSATHPDAQVGLPSEGAFQRMIRDWQMTPGFDGNDARIAALSTAILDLIRPAFEAKERGGVGNSDGIASPFNACCYRDECRAMEARALSAEAKLAQAVEAGEICRRARTDIESPVDIIIEVDRGFRVLTRSCGKFSMRHTTDPAELVPLVSDIIAETRARAAARGEKGHG